ncbi:hypothetical protein L505_3640 [Bordetella bronchiseptica F4563]|uniref:hypothetical protein n=1 Tax=Bordetella bronchiseptica TaxID=518 RepID=UPI000460CFA6|nr:hypothetical protein [Bordetella bronchiseptica]KDC31759.1 hypothetical protein L505_3640 [Bordetella bronchiseptica F4563]QET71450.1 hypothetical protein FOB42_14525 [Bordetella bronchiseptica]
MGKPIRAALERAYCAHRRIFAMLEGWLLILLMVGGGVGIGFFLGGLRADALLADQARGHAAELQRMQASYQYLVENLAPQVRQAATDAKGAARAARGAATTARQAAKTAKGAAEEVQEAVTPPPRVDKPVPQWLNTP